MNFKEYQKAAKETAMYPEVYSVIYPTLGLNGEAGEVAEKVKKFLRDGTSLEALREVLSKELGDVLWYVAAICSDLELDLGDVARANIFKLQDRKIRGVLGGAGDER
jgi:NTP pyrophosphatase (non-canonical NTP hydrolase)